MFNIDGLCEYVDVASSLHDGAEVEVVAGGNNSFCEDKWIIVFNLFLAIEIQSLPTRPYFLFESRSFQRVVDCSNRPTGNRSTLIYLKMQRLF